jgi:hypothetical protein
MESSEEEVRKLTRQLKIKTNVLRRLRKEQKMYDREVQEYQSRESELSEQLRACLEESRAMQRDCAKRVECAFLDLEDFVDVVVSSGSRSQTIESSEEFVLADEQLREARKTLT